MRSGKINPAKSRFIRTISRRTEDAVAAVIEKLESRMLLSTGLPDLAAADSGPVEYAYGSPPSAESSTGFYWPAGMNDFAPPINDTATTSSLAPAIAAADLAAQPGQAMTVTGSGFDSGANVNVLVYGQTTTSNGTSAPAQIQDATTVGAMLTLSSSLPPNSLYLVWPANSNGYSSPIAVNQTDAQWMSLTPATGSSYNDNTLATTLTVTGTLTATITVVNATYGQGVSVYGQNLTNGAEGSQSWVFLDSTTNSNTGYWVPVTSANPYSIQFNVPAGSPVAAGTAYNVYVNNGLGGSYTWSQVPGMTLNLASSTPQWPTCGAHTYVISYSNSATTLDSALTNAITSITYAQVNSSYTGLSTIEFQSGTYTFGSSGSPILFNIPSNTLVIGLSQSATILNFPQDPTDNTSLPNGGPYDIGTLTGSTNNVEFENLSMVYTGSADSGNNFVEEDNGNNFTFDSVTISGNSLCPVYDNYDSALTFENSIFIGGAAGGAAIDCYFSEGNLIFNNDTFYLGFQTENAIFLDATNVAVTNCGGYDIADLFTGNSPLTALFTSTNTYDQYGQGQLLDLNGAGSYNVYAADNTTDFADPMANVNEGNQFIEDTTGDAPYFYGVLSGTAGTQAFTNTTATLYLAQGSVNFSGTLTFAGTDDYAGAGKVIEITNGPGTGEMRTITGSTTTFSGTTTTVTLTLSNPWTVVPSSDSRIFLGYEDYNIVYYKNSLSDQPGTIGAVNLMDASGPLISISYDVVADGNTITDVKYGFDLASVAWLGNDFVSLVNNQVINPLTVGIFESSQPLAQGASSNYDPTNDPREIGVNMGGNTIAWTDPTQWLVAVNYDSTPYPYANPDTYTFANNADYPTPQGIIVGADSKGLPFEVDVDNGDWTYASSEEMLSAVQGNTVTFNVPGTSVTGFVGIGLFYDPNVLVSGNQVTVALSGTATSTNSFAVALAEPVGTGGVSGSNTFTPTAIVVNTIASGSLAYVLEKTTCVGDGTESFAPTFTNTYSNSTIYVDANVASGGADDGTSWANAYTSVFTAISTANADASSTNRVAILVAEGTYYPNSTNTASVATSSTFTLYNDVSIIGGYPTGGATTPGTFTTVLSGGSTAYHVVTATNVDSSALLENFTIQDGNAAGSSGTDGDGGGLFFATASPTMENCIVTDCDAGTYGGALYNSGGDPTISQCSFSDNSLGDGAYGLGGAIFNTGGTLTVTQSDFNGNDATDAYFQEGGAIGNDASGVLNLWQCTFESNESIYGDNGGGALSNIGYASVTDCTFSNNYTGSNGGAILNLAYYTPGSMAVTNCVFVDNGASGFAGAIYNFGISVDTASLIVTNSTFTSNYAAGYGGAVVTNDGSTTIVNSILWDDTVDSSIAEVYGATVTYSDIDQSGYAESNGNISAAPAFVNTGDFPLELTAVSPCINTGSTAALEATGVTTDAAGNPALIDGNADIGAYEYQSPTITWVGSSAGNWNIASNWSDDQVPSQYDNVVFTGAFTVTLNGACVTSSVTGTAASIVVPSDGNGILSLVGTLATSTLAQITVCSGGTLTLEATTEATLAAAISNTGTLVAYNFGTLVASGVISGTGALYVTGTGTLNLLGSNTYTGGTSVLDGKLIASSAASIPTNSSLTIGSDGGTAVCALTTTTQTFSLSQLNIYSGSTFNLNDNEVLIDYGASTDPITAIQSYLSTGYAGGTWNGTGINSGSVASADSNQSTLKYAVGYADGADDYTTAVSSGEIEILPTLAGDAKLQGNVVFGDYQILGQYFGHTNTSWDESDFTYNGTTNFGDFQMLAQDFGADASALSGYIADPSPPTVTLTLVASGGNWSVYANDTSDDNVGIASFDIDVVGDGGAEVTGSYEAAAYGSSGVHSAGFNVDASNGDDQNEDGAGDGMEILVSQNVLGYNGASTVIQGFGQSSGSEYGASWVQTGSGALIASGTYSGSGTLSVNVDSGGFIQVLNIVSAGVWSGQGNLADAAVTGDTISV